jgi:hypothetical protein
VSNNRENGLGSTKILLPAFVAAAMIIYAHDTFAQELEARTYTNTPTGVNFISVGYLHSQGNVLIDPALPIEGLDGSVNLGFLRYTRSLGLFGNSSKLKVLVPFTSGDWRGELEGVPQSRSATGAGDLRLTLEVNFLGAPALSTKEFSNFKPRTIVGGSVRIIAPTGEYDETKLINLGSNRWAFRPEFGASRVFGHWDLTIAGAAWFYTDNDEFFGGSTLSQDPLYVIKGHAVYTVRPGFWVGFGSGVNLQVPRLLIRDDTAACDPKRTLPAGPDMRRNGLSSCSMMPNELGCHRRESFEMSIRVHIAVIVLACSLGVGCSEKSWFYSGQSYQRSHCQWVPPSEYDDCMEQTRKSHGTYQKERKEVEDGRD